jgi:hypothetical protein
MVEYFWHSTKNVASTGTEKVYSYGRSEGNWPNLRYLLQDVLCHAMKQVEPQLNQTS